MKNDNKTKIVSIMLTVGLLCLSISAIALLLFEKNNDYISIFTVIALGLILLLNISMTIIPRIRDIANESPYDKDLSNINKLIKYNKQREEIEQEIRKLTSELVQSDVSQYVDINRLAFSAQNSLPANSAINYENFLNQFGLDKSNISIEMGHAAYLAPFTNNGRRVFLACQNTLSQIGIILHRTDNYVDKDDILLNIVSLIVHAEIVLVNIDGRNPNVYYELGIAHALGKPTILLSSGKFETEKIGFDLRQKRIIIFNNEKELETELLRQVNIIRHNTTAIAKDRDLL